MPNTIPTFHNDDDFRVEIEVTEVSDDNGDNAPAKT